MIYEIESAAYVFNKQKNFKCRSRKNEQETTVYKKLVSMPTK